MRETLEQLLARATAGAYIPSIGEMDMPKAVKLAKGKKLVASTGGAAITKYPWNEWFNPNLKDFPDGYVHLEQSAGEKNEKGTVDKITEKKDYEVDTDAMPAKIKTAARARYKVVTIFRKDADNNKLVNSLIIQARDMTAEEKVAEDLLRAEEKAARKEKKAAEGDDDGDDTPVTYAAQTSGS